uniref:Solute carrier family 43 member 1a n=1 Tax=Lates calcarifer TaxID=8187 RepID=A0A4W6EQC3_LATCA
MTLFLVSHDMETNIFLMSLLCREKEVLLDADSVGSYSSQSPEPCLVHAALTKQLSALYWSKHTQHTVCVDNTSLPNMFGALSSTVMSLMIGSYASSAVTFPGVKLIYDAGVSFQVIMWVWGGLAASVFFNCFFNWPKKTEPEKWRRATLHREASQCNLLLSSDTVPFRRSLRIIFFMGPMNKMLEFMVTHGEEHPSEELVIEAKEKVSFYSSIFGTLQLLCLVTCPLIGYIMDWKMKECEEEKVAPQTDRKIQRVTNAMRAFIFTNMLLLAFGFCCLIDNLPLQILTFILHTMVRGFIHSCCGGLYAGCVSLQSMISAVVALLQQPLFIAMINLGLLIFSLAGFLLPCYLFYHRRQLLREKEARDKRANGQEMQALNHTEANGHKPHSNGCAAVEA